TRTNDDLGARAAGFVDNRDGLSTRRHPARLGLRRKRKRGGRGGEYREPRNNLMAHDPHPNDVPMYWFPGSGTSKAAPISVQPIPLLAVVAKWSQAKPRVPLSKFATHCSMLDANFGSAGTRATL